MLAKVVLNESGEQTLGTKNSFVDSSLPRL